MSEKPEPSVRLFAYHDDQPRESIGILIPRHGRQTAKHNFTPTTVAKTQFRVVTARVMLGVVALFLLSIVGAAGYGLIASGNLASLPTVTVVGPHSDATAVLEYGPQTALTKKNFFVATRDAFIDEELTFLEIDLDAKMLRYFEKGILLQSAEILSVAEAGTWWETPSGLYQLEQKDKKLFTNVGQAYLPWLLTFQSNYLIHGWPVYPDGTSVPADFSAGGVRLSDESAQALFEQVSMDIPVLVHATDQESRDTFVYEPQVPDIEAPHYFIADVDNGAILAASDLSDTAPIASVVKLMTAVVAAEELSLDGRVRVTSPTFVTSLVPRLSERSSVSMYSLLQLLLVESSNEAAETIAGELGREVFIEAMNAKARQLGMMHTHFADPSGLSAENISTLGDLYRLTKYIYKERKFVFSITAGENLPNTYVGDEFSGLINFNEIEDMDSFVGGKVGETNAAGQTSISLHQLEFGGKKRTLAVIVLGSENRTEDVTALINYVQTRYAR